MLEIKLINDFDNDNIIKWEDHGLYGGPDGLYQVFFSILFNDIIVNKGDNFYYRIYRLNDGLTLGNYNTEINGSRYKPPYYSSTGVPEISLNMRAIPYICGSFDYYLDATPLEYSYTPLVLEVIHVGLDGTTILNTVTKEFMLTRASNTASWPTSTNATILGVSLPRYLYGYNHGSSQMITYWRSRIVFELSDSLPPTDGIELYADFIENNIMTDTISFYSDETFSRVSDKKFIADITFIELIDGNNLSTQQIQQQSKFLSNAQNIKIKIKEFFNISNPDISRTQINTCNEIILNNNSNLLTNFINSKPTLIEKDSSKTIIKTIGTQYYKITYINCNNNILSGKIQLNDNLKPIFPVGSEFKLTHWFYGFMNPGMWDYNLGPVSISDRFFYDNASNVVIYHGTVVDENFIEFEFDLKQQTGLDLSKIDFGQISYFGILPVLKSTDSTTKLLSTNLEDQYAQYVIPTFSSVKINFNINGNSIADFSNLSNSYLITPTKYNSSYWPETAPAVSVSLIDINTGLPSKLAKIVGSNIIELSFGLWDIFSNEDFQFVYSPAYAALSDQQKYDWYITHFIPKVNLQLEFTTDFSNGSELVAFEFSDLFVVNSTLTKTDPNYIIANLPGSKIITDNVFQIVANDNRTYSKKQLSELESNKFNIINPVNTFSVIDLVKNTDEINVIENGKGFTIANPYNVRTTIRQIPGAQLITPSGQTEISLGNGEVINLRKIANNKFVIESHYKGTTSSGGISAIIDPIAIEPFKLNVIRTNTSVNCSSLTSLSTAQILFMPSGSQTEVSLIGTFIIDGQTVINPSIDIKNSIITLVADASGNILLAL